MKAAAAGAAALLLAVTARAQIVPRGISGSGLAYPAQLVVRYQGELLRQTGTLFGASGSAELGPTTLVMGTLAGTLRPSTATASDPERSVRTTWVAVYLRPASLVALGGEVEARRYETVAGVAWARLIGASAMVTLPLGVAGLTGGVVLDYLPLSSASGADSVSAAVRGTFGLMYSAAGLPVFIHLAYRIERFDFKGAGTHPQRLEQFDGIIAGAGLRIGK